MIAQKQKVKFAWQTPKDINNKKKLRQNFGQKYMNRIWYKNEQTKMEEKNINILNIVRFDKLKSKLRKYDSIHTQTHIYTRTAFYIWCWWKSTSFSVDCLPLTDSVWIKHVVLTHMHCITTQYTLCALSTVVAALISMLIEQTRIEWNRIETIPN